MMRAIIYLGYGFLFATLMLLLRKGGGKQRFLEGYGRERLVPTFTKEADFRAAFEHCIGCGFCEFALLNGEGIQKIAQSDWRSPECWLSIENELKFLDSHQLTQAEMMCPFGVPLSEMVKNLRLSIAEIQKFQGKLTQSDMLI